MPRTECEGDCFPGRSHAACIFAGLVVARGVNLFISWRGKFCANILRTFTPFVNLDFREGIFVWLLEFVSGVHFTSININFHSIMNFSNRRRQNASCGRSRCSTTVSNPFSFSISIVMFFDFLLLTVDDRTANNRQADRRRRHDWKAIINR